MLIEEVWPAANPRLDEGLKQQLGRLAMIGALGAGSLAGGYGLGNLTGDGTRSAQATTVPFTSTVLPTDNDRGANVIGTTTPGISTPSTGRSAVRSVVSGGSPHAALPQELHGQPAARRTELIKNFSNAMLPLINQANQAIRNERNEIIRIRGLPSIGSQDMAKLNALASRYNVQVNDSRGNRRANAAIISDLLLRVDVIPPNLALSQAALETRWGSDDLFRQGLNAFGQKATQRHLPNQVIRHTDRVHYRAYDSLLHSVQSYMHNLNTHEAYSEFRSQRKMLRRQTNNNADMMGRELTKYLHGYSTNPEYGTKLVQVMSTARSVREST